MFLNGGGYADARVLSRASVAAMTRNQVPGIGSDFDGLIIPPSDLSSGAHYPRLAELMLARGWSTTRIQKVLGKNLLRVLEAIRP